MLFLLQTPPQVSPPQCVRKLSAGEGTPEALFLHDEARGKWGKGGG